MLNLRVPGPTPLPLKVRKAIYKQVISHRSKDYEEIQKRITENLQYFFQTENDIFLLTCSGMGGLEAVISNFFSAGDTIVSFTCGDFGNRWAELARCFGARVIQVKFPAGRAISKDQVHNRLKNRGRIAGVLFTHNETSTGVLNNVAEFASIVKNHPLKPLVLVDSISGLGAIDLPVGASGMDVVVSASQKAWMAPPGIAMIAVSSAAWERHATRAKMPRYYFDISQYRKFAEKNQTPATPAVSTLFGLDMALQLMRKEGRENIFRRHLKLRDYLRAGIKEIGLQLFVRDEDASPTVTAIKIPKGIDGSKWLSLLQEKYKVVLAGGMGETKGKIIRVAHMGYVKKRDLDDVLVALKKSLKKIKKST